MNMLGKPNVGQLKADRNIRGLLRALRNRENDIRGKAADALGEIAEPKTANVLFIRARKDKSVWVRAKAIRALANFQGTISFERYFSFIRDSLCDKDSIVRAAAADALGMVKDPRAIGELITGLGDRDIIVQQASSFALGKIGNEAVHSLVWELKNPSAGVRREVARALGITGSSDAVEPLVNALSDDESSVREFVIHALGKIRDKRAVFPLMDYLDDNDIIVRQEAINALVLIADPVSLPVLGETLKNNAINKDIRIHELVIFTLVHEQTDDAVKMLVLLLSCEDTNISNDAFHALEKINEQKILEPLANQIESRNPRFKIQACKLLGRRGNSQAVELLAEILDKNSSYEVRIAVVDALKAIAAIEVAPILAKILKEDPSDDLRLAAAGGLKGMASSVVVSIFMEYAYDPISGIRNIAYAMIKPTLPANSEIHLWHKLQDESITIKMKGDVAVTLLRKGRSLKDPRFQYFLEYLEGLAEHPFNEEMTGYHVIGEDAFGILTEAEYRTIDPIAEERQEALQVIRKMITCAKKENDIEGLAHLCSGFLA